MEHEVDARFIRLKKHQIFQFLTNTRELLVLLLFYLAFLKAPFSEPALVVNYKLTKLIRPIAATKVVNPPEFTVANGCNGLSDLVSSKILFTLEVKNTSPARINDLDLKVEGVRSIADVAVFATSTQLVGKTPEIAGYKLEDGVVSFPSFSSIPSKSSVTILLWGDISDYWSGQRILAASSAPTMSIEETAESTGTARFIDENLGSILILLFSYLFLLSLYRSRRMINASA